MTPWRWRLSARAADVLMGVALILFFIAVALLTACRREPRDPPDRVETVASWGYVEDADLREPGDTAYICPLGRFASGRLFISQTAQRYTMAADSSWSSATVPSLPACAAQYQRLGLGLGPGTLMVPMRLEAGPPLRDSASVRPRPLRHALRRA